MSKRANLRISTYSCKFLWDRVYLNLSESSPDGSKILRYSVLFFPEHTFRGINVPRYDFSRIFFGIQFSRKEFQGKFFELTFSEIPKYDIIRDFSEIKFVPGNVCSGIYSSV